MPRSARQRLDTWSYVLHWFDRVKIEASKRNPSCSEVLPAAGSANRKMLEWIAGSSGEIALKCDDNKLMTRRSVASAAEARCASTDRRGAMQAVNRLINRPGERI